MTPNRPSTEPTAGRTAPPSTIFPAPSPSALPPVPSPNPQRRLPMAVKSFVRRLLLNNRPQPHAPPPPREAFGRCEDCGWTGDLTQGLNTSRMLCPACWETELSET
jgi:hypothetical protein